MAKNAAEVYTFIERVAHEFSGQFSLAAEHLGTGQTIVWDENRLMETASVIKLPILAAAMQWLEAQHHTPDFPVVYIPEDRVEGSGILQNLSPGLSLPFQDALMLMITLSDNTATNLVLRHIGLATVNDTMEAMGFPHIRILKRIDFSAPGPIGLAPATELSGLLKKLHARQIVSRQASDFMWHILIHQQYNTLMTRYLPYALLEDTDTNPAAVVVASKSGSLEGIRNDVGIVSAAWGSYTVALLSEGCQDLRFHVDNEAAVVLPRLTQILFDYFLGDH